MAPNLTALLRERSTAALEHALASASPASVEALALEGELARRAGLWPVAIARLAAAAERAPEAIVVRHCLALAQLQAGDGAAGRATLAAILEAHPDDPVAHFQRAVSLERDGLAVDAAREYEAHLARHAGHVAAWHNLGLLELGRGRADAAQRAFGEVVARDPRHHNAWLGLGSALQQLRRTREATAAFMHAHALRPVDVEPLRRAAAAFGELAELPRAIELLQTAIALAPNDVHLRLQCASHQSNLGLHAASLEQLRTACSLAAHDARVHSALLLELQYGGEAITAQALGRAHWEWAHAYADAVPPVAIPRVRRRRARMRIGYLSPRFGIGPLAPFLLPVLETHDRERVEVVLFAATPGADAIVERMRSAADKWHDLPASDDAAAELIAHEELDLLVDLAGHAPGHRLGVLARKPAPVQATWLDYFDTTGMAAVDYLIGDPIETPPADAAHFRERLVLLPCRFAYRALHPARATPLPAATRGHVTFGSFNRHAKINDRVLECWGGILREMPQARLVLRAAAYKGASTIAWLREQWRRWLPMERVDLLPWLPWDQALAGYADIDIALDPFPYNGGLTTCDALAHGVPVVALAGDRMIARQSAALLVAAGRPEWVAADRDGYVGLACTLARDRALARIRSDLQAAVPRTALGDVTAFTRRLERAFNIMMARGPRLVHAGHPLPPIEVE